MRVARHRVVDASPDAVWRVIAPVERLPRWLSGVESAALLSGPAEGVGRRHRLVRLLYGREVQVEQEVAVWEPGRVLSLRHVREVVEGRDSTGVRNFHTTVALSPQGQKTRVSVEYRWDSPLGIPFVQSLMAGRVMGKELRETLRNIEKLAKGGLIA